MPRTNKSQQKATETDDAKRERTISAVIASPTLTAAAKVLGISEMTLARRLKEPETQDAWRVTRREVYNQSITGIQRATEIAVRTLVSVMENEAAQAGARVSAARTVLDSASKAIELDDLATRLEALEAAMGETKR